MEQVFALVGNLDSIQPLVVVARGLIDELRNALDDPTIGPAAVRLLSQVEYFESQIASLRRRLRPHAATVLLVPPKLSIYALGRSQVKVAGKVITNASWVNHKRAREMFFFLLTHLNKGMTKEEIGVDLWPESSSEKLRLQFKNTIYYLRYALGQEAIINDGHYYSFNTDMDYSYDVQEFERKIQQSETTTITPGKKIELLQSAVQLYQGAFFPEGEETWVMTERQRLARIYENALLTLAQLYLEQGAPKTTLTYCQKIIAENHCQEAGHRLAMQAYAALGDRAGIANQYDDCRQALAEELGLEPSPETAKLYKILR
jgi:two-component SAPR family response regulator